ncbi:tetraspanin-15-like [Ammospiza caudacuta]|uniref:tetraspanin-15-like n=1 Tax=Ammospiza caudacuta TaxID=2857398 RepID=UPI002738B7BB|nr:tetraspanin-15-like [Ammospiza caudacuta]
MGRTCRESNFYYYSIKFALSAYATLFSLLGLLLLALGAYAEAERQRHRTLEGIFLAPAVLLLLLGSCVFLVSFVGMVGSLRDNRALLRTFFWVLLLIFLTELLLILVEIIFESKMNEVFHSNIQEGIRHYYDDLDFKNILDFVQEKFSCCGGDEFRDWEVNQYHRCNGSGALACGVPHSCCVRGARGAVVNTLCGYRALDKERLELLGTIHVRGCIHAVGLWLKDNFQATLAIVCSLLLPQVLGLAMAWLHWQQLNELRSRWDFVDSRPGPGAAALDLSGAGCCWCLPRDGGYGSTGNTGSNGNDGDYGNNRDTGDTGNNGNDESTRKNGNNGDYESTGNDGDTGNMESAGSTGSCRSTGNNGMDGDNGDTGSAGSIGSTGNNGNGGSTRNNGNDRDTGSTGNNGNGGDSWNSGDTGIIGNNGNSWNGGDTGSIRNNGSTGNGGWEEEEEELDEGAAFLRKV